MVDAVRPGAVVRVRLRGGEAWEGDLAGTRDGRILLTGGRDTLRLAASDVSALWVRERRVAFGPELELQGVGSANATQLVYPDCAGQPGCPPPVEETVRESYRAGAVRGLVRVGPETGRMRAYGLLGAGMHGWRTPAHDSEGREYGGSWYIHPAGVAGAGVQLRPGAGPLSVGMEGRLNRVVLSGDDFPGRYWTAALTFNTSL